VCLLWRGLIRGLGGQPAQLLVGQVLLQLVAVEQGDQVVAKGGLALKSLIVNKTADLGAVRDKRCREGFLKRRSGTVS